MKKVFCVSLVLAVLVGCLAACNVQSNMSGALAGAAEPTPKVEEMMQALAENRASDAKALLHPQKAEQAEAALTQLSAYLAGRKADALEQININIKTFSGASGKTRQEQVSYQVTLTDGAVIYLNVVYLSDNAGTGFSSFQLVLGVV